ncbi:MAG: prephenate dehydratase [Cellulomonadaceae bacterium]
MRELAYLGPEGSFTHAAALTWATGPLRACASVAEVFAAVEDGSARGVVAIESSVEGYVVPSLDEIVAARDVVAVDEVALDITFDAFVLPGGGERREITAHPHGLAQCREYVRASGLVPVPAASNAAACRDLAPGQVALGPSICGELYGLERVASGVQDFDGARTRFLLLDGRGEAVAGRRESLVGPWRSMIAVTPHMIGPGVLARITAAFGRAGVNMSSLITRPLKAQEGIYVFVVTFDGAPWEPGVRGLLGELLAAEDSLKVLGVFPARHVADAAFDVEQVPAGSVDASCAAAELDRTLLW